MKRQATYLTESAAVERLEQRAVRGGMATLFAQIAKFLVRLISAMILARLLTPEDFGLLAMIMAVSSFLTPFRDMGLPTATLQKTEINQGQVSNLFWINTVVGAVLSLGFAAAAPLISYFYSKPILTPIIWVFSVKFLIGGIANQHLALLRRKMRFASLSLLEVSAFVLASVAAIGAAWIGLGPWALVIQQLAHPFVIALGVWLICPWRPGGPSRNSGVRSMVTFGSQLTVSEIMFALMRNFDDLLIGWRWGAEALGLYSKAYALLLIPLNQISRPLNSVSVASLSRLQTDPDRYRRFYCRLVTILAYATTPLLVILAVLSRDIILVILGEQWVEASTIFTVLAIAAIGQPMAGTMGLVMTSLGQTDRMLRLSLITTPLTIISFLIGLPWGPLGVATAYAAAVHLIRFPSFWYAFRYAPVKTKDFLKAAWRPFVVSGWMFFFMAGARHYLAMQQPIERLFICCIVGVVAFVGGILIWPETRRETIELILHVKKLLRPPRNSPTNS